MSATIFCFIKALLFFIFCTIISVNLHDWMFTSLVRAPTKFFDDNPSGKVEYESLKLRDPLASQLM